MSDRLNQLRTAFEEEEGGISVTDLHEMAFLALGEVDRLSLSLKDMQGEAISQGLSYRQDLELGYRDMIKGFQDEIAQLKEFIREPIEYAESRPQGERGWKTWLAKVRAKYAAN